MKILLLASLAVLLIQTVNPIQQQKPTGSIEGTVTRAGSSQPVMNARVTVTRRAPSPATPPGLNANVIAAAPAVVAGARGTPPAPIPAVMTDDKGKFVVSGLEDGAYNVQVGANGYVGQPYGQRITNGPGAPVNVSGGLPSKDINVALSPAANISGRVSDTSRQPLVDVPVQLVRSAYDSMGQRTYVSVGNTVTDDRGAYRIYWITPGRYYLLAGKPSSGSSPLDALMQSDLRGTRANGNEVPSVPGYAFYPGVQEIANARTIDLQPAADLQSFDLTLDTRPRMFKARGQVVDTRTGQAPARASVTVAPQMPGLGERGISFLGSDMPNQNYNPKTGVFEIRDLLPGTYSIVAVVVDVPVPGRPGPLGQSFGTAPVTINSSDADGITIPVVPAAAIPGRIRIEGQAPSQLTMDRLRVRLVSISGGRLVTGILQNPQGVVAADGTFRFQNVIPGDYRIEVSGLPPINPDGTTAVQAVPLASTPYLKDARLDGTDVLNSPMRFSGSVNNGLEIVLAFGTGRVEGTATDARLQPAVGGRVVAIPERARFRTDLYRQASIDQTGRFVFPSILPGDYKVFAWEFVEDNGWFDPDLLSRSEGRARSVHVSASATETVTVQISPAESSR